MIDISSMLIHRNIENICVSIAQSAMTSQELVCFDWRAVSAVSQRLRNVPNGLCGDIPNIRHTLSWL